MSEFIGTDHPEIQAMLNNKSFKVIKKAETLVRYPTEEEIGSVIDTFVEKDGIIKKESNSYVEDTSVIARNPEALSNGEFNEWAMPLETFEKNYGTIPTTEFKAYKKIITNNVIVIDYKVLKILNSKDKKTAKLAVNWGNGFMLVQEGDFLFDTGYAVDKREFNNTYEII